jgi:hypothetical protein
MTKELKCFLRCIVAWGATFLVPLVVFWLVSKALWDLLPADWFDTRTLSVLDPKGVDFGGFARDVNGRMNFAVMSVAIWAASLIAISLASFVVYRNLSGRLAAFFILIGIAVGCAIAHSESSLASPDCRNSSTAVPPMVAVPRDLGFRFVVIDNVLCVAESHRPATTAVLQNAKAMILRNSYLGFAGAGAVMAALAALAMRYGAWSKPVNLRRRLDDFRTLTLMAGILFALNALVTKALVSWTQSLLADDVASKFAPLGSALLEYWAVQASTVFFTTVALAAIFIQWDIRDAASENLPKESNLIGSGQARVADLRRDMTNAPAIDSSGVQAGVDDGKRMTDVKWIESNELTFDTATVVAATIGTIAPLLAGPAVDLVTKALH